MLVRFRYACLFLIAALAWGQRPSPEETASAVELTRKVAFEYGRSLPDFVCTEVVHRYRGLAGGRVPQPVDTLTVKLTYYGRREEHQLVLVDGRPTDQTFDKLEGAFTSGEFGDTLLRVLNPVSKAVFTWERWTRERDRPAAVYAYQVDAAYAPFDIFYRNSAAWTQVAVGLHGVLEVDRQTGQPLHFTYVADAIPASCPVKASQTSVDYTLTEIGGREYLLPAVSEVQMQSEDPQTSRWGRAATAVINRNSMEFRDYRKFSAESTLTFTPDK